MNSIYKNIIFVIFSMCVLLAPCASIRTYAAEIDSGIIKEDDTYIYYQTGVYDKLTGQYFLYEQDGYLDDENNFVLGSRDSDNRDEVSEIDGSLSEKHLEILDALGDLLDYVPKGDEKEIELEEIEKDVLPTITDIPDSSDYIQDIAQNVSTLSDVALLSDYNTYVGAISTTYLEYFRGFLGKLPYNYHYVCYRESQYVYSFVFGTDLSYSSKRFTGSNLTRVTWNTYNSGSYGINQESSFSLNVGSNMVYTDLGNDYPALVAYDGYQLIQIKWLLIIGSLSVWMTTLYKGIHSPVDKDRYSAHKNAD